MNKKIWWKNCSEKNNSMATFGSVLLGQKRPVFSGHSVLPFFFATFALFASLR
jgi:hypothetical protein